MNLSHFVVALLGLAGVGAACQADEHHEIADPLVRYDCAPGELAVKSAEQITATLDALEQRIEDVMVSGTVQTLSIAIIADKEVIYSAGFGTTKDTPRQAGSLSKVVTAFGALALVAEGQLAKDEPLSAYVDDPYLPSEVDADAITLAMVLSHTSGLGNDVTGEDRSVYFTPGTRFGYSGGGFRYLQQAMEDVTATAFDTWMEREILSRLQMSGSNFTAYYQGFPFVNAAASLVAPPVDIARLLGELADPTPANEVIVQQMNNPIVEIDEALSWGLGLGILHSERDGEILWHWGNNFDTHHTLALIYEQYGIGVVVMTTGSEGAAVARSIVQQAIGGSCYADADRVPRVEGAGSG